MRKAEEAQKQDLDRREGLTCRVSAPGSVCSLLSPPGGNNTSWPPQIRSVSDSAFMVPNGSNKMQEAFCQMSLSSDITGESGNGICLHSRNSSVQGQGEAEMARGAESNLGLVNEQERLLRSNLSSGSKHTVWHALVLLTRLDSLLSCLHHKAEGEARGERGYLSPVEPRSSAETGGTHAGEISRRNAGNVFSDDISPGN